MSLPSSDLVRPNFKMDAGFVLATTVEIATTPLRVSSAREDGTSVLAQDVGRPIAPWGSHAMLEYSDP